MDKQEVGHMRVEGNRKCSETELRRILEDTPITITRSRGSRLMAWPGRMDNTIYVEPVRGYIENVQLGDGVEKNQERSDKRFLIFHYQDRTYAVVIAH